MPREQRFAVTFCGKDIYSPPARRSFSKYAPKTSAERRDMASENHISQYSPRQGELFIQKSTRVAVSCLRRAEAWGTLGGLRPFFDVLGESS